MTVCEDCGDECLRRTGCKSCGQLVCRWCYHHCHNLKDEMSALIPCPRKAYQLKHKLIKEATEPLIAENSRISRSAR